MATKTLRDFAQAFFYARLRVFPVYLVFREHVSLSKQSSSGGMEAWMCWIRPEGQIKDSRKEVIQPQVPLRLPCYDFTPVTSHSLGTCLPCGLAQPLLEQLTPMV